MSEIRFENSKRQLINYAWRHRLELFRLWKEVKKSENWTFPDHVIKCCNLIGWARNCYDVILAHAQSKNNTGTTYEQEGRLSGELELLGFKSVCIVVSINNISLLKTDSDREKYELSNGTSFIKKFELFTASMSSPCRAHIVALSCPVVPCRPQPPRCPQSPPVGPSPPSPSCG